MDLTLFVYTRPPRVRFESVETFRRWHCHTQSATDSICAGPCGRLRRVSRAPSCDFASQSSSCYSSGDLTTSSQVHLPSKATLSSAHFRPASLDLGLAFRWPISRARRQMRGDRIKCLGLRTYRTSCINATDSICRRARMESQRVGRGRRPRRPATAIKRKSRCGAVAGGRGRPPLPPLHMSAFR